MYLIENKGDNMNTLIKLFKTICVEPFNFRENDEDVRINYFLRKHIQEITDVLGEYTKTHREVRELLRTIGDFKLLH